MTESRTAEALNKQLQPYSKMIISTKERSIAKRYKRIQEAIQYMLNNVRGDGTVVVTKELLESLLSL